MQANDTIYYSEVGIYTFLSLFSLMAILSFLSIFILYWAKRFACRYMLSALWVLSGLLATLLFLGSGVLMIGALTAYDGCTAYHEITTVQNTLTSLPSYSSSQFVQTLEACFFAAGSGSDTVFGVFSQSSTFSRLKNI